jgi:hypothetical protein
MASTANADGTFNVRVNGENYLFFPRFGLTGIYREDHIAYGNLTLFENREDLCTLSTCSLTLSHFDYRPSLGGNAFVASLFALIILMNIYLGFRHKTWGYMACVSLGLTGEFIGYIARILLYSNPFPPTDNNFLITMICLTMSPALLAAGIYLCLSRIIVVYGSHFSRFKPRTYTMIFCSCDLVSLLVQSGGGGIAASANTPSQNDLGINVMLAGLIFQVVSLALFAACCADFAYRVHRKRGATLSEHGDLTESRLFKAFLYALSYATLAIFVRSIFRVAELSDGFNGPLANDEVTFMLLEGTMIITGMGVLAILHPGIAFQGVWAQADFVWWGEKKANKEKHSSADGSIEEGVKLGPVGSSSHGGNF